MTFSDGLRAAPDHLSWSQVSSLNPDMPFGCARAWAIERILGMPYEASAAMKVGSAFDHAVNAMFMPRALAHGDLGVAVALEAGQMVLAMELGEAMDGMSSDEEREAFAATAAMAGASLEAYAAMNQATPVGATQQEVEFFVDGQIRVIGFIDRVDVGRRIVDLKVTGKSKKHRDGTWDEEQTAMWKWQLSFYATALEAEAKDAGLAFSWPVSAQVEQVVLRAGQAKPSIEVWQTQIDESARHEVEVMIRASWATVKSGVYPANPGPKCGNCSARVVCREIQKANETDFAVQWSKVR